jgi:hypothetical protein
VRVEQLLPDDVAEFQLPAGNVTSEGETDWSIQHRGELRWSMAGAAVLHGETRRAAR